MGENPQHNQHVIEQANALDAAFSENNQQIMLMLREFSRRLDKIEAELNSLKKTVEARNKNNTPTPMMADVYFTPSSMKKAKSELVRYLN